MIYSTLEGYNYGLRNLGSTAFERTLLLLWLFQRGDCSQNGSCVLPALLLLRKGSIVEMLSALA